MGEIGKGINVDSINDVLGLLSDILYTTASLVCTGGAEQ